MTSETDALKTIEFLRRRKLRIQQVREQSKEIAKKIRQRAKVEKFRHNVDLDERKQKEYFEHQDKLIKKLEHYYANGIRSVGVGHRNAADVNLQDISEKADLSKKRGKEATAELRRKKQEKLDEQKKLLDRKLQARETANEISRDKSSSVASKLLPSKVLDTTKPNDETSKRGNRANTNIDSSLDRIPSSKSVNQHVGTDKPVAGTSDMATQWDFEEVPNEWDPQVPELVLPKDDRHSPKKSPHRHGDSKTENSRRLNLFALSNDMPSSLRGGLSSVPEENIPMKPSLTLVSEYLQSRVLRLRESDTTIPSKRDAEDLQSIKQTILRTRSSRNQGSEFSNVCHVADVQVVPVPSWQPETFYGLCPHHMQLIKNRQFKSVTNSQINKIFSSIRPVQRDEPSPSPVLRGSSPFRRSKVSHTKCKQTVKESSMEKTSKSSEPPSAKKNSVMMYNHFTRDTRDIPYGDRRLVIRDLQTDEDAYSQAMKESSSDKKNSQNQKKIKDMRNKVAMTKQNVEKEYKDTMTFLSSLPKDKSKPMKNAYMNDQRQKMQKDSRQWKLQQEFKKIEKDCRRNAHMNPKPTSVHDKIQSKSKSPSKLNSDDDFNERDFQYSWMPVPDSDGSLAIHTIPTTLRDNKSNNTVKFNNVDSYHEYRSRHRHTPPTKDNVTHVKNSNKRFVEAVVIQQGDEESTEGSSVASDSSSVENLPFKTDHKAGSSKEREEQVSDAERIIIYKILDSKIDKKDKGKTNSRLIEDYAKSLTSIDRDRILKYVSAAEKDADKVDKQKIPHMKRVSRNAETRVSFEQLNEGVYRTVNEKGDNIGSLQVSDSPRSDDQPIVGEDAIRHNQQSSCKKKLNKEPQNIGVHCERGDDPSVARPQSTSNEERKCSCGSRPNSAKQSESSKPVPQSVESNASFKTARTNKSNVVKEGEFIKLLDDGGQESGKFYIGATGFLQDNAYEVVIQLRKKDAEKDGRKETETQATEARTTPTNVTEKDDVKENHDTYAPTSEGIDAYMRDFRTSGSGKSGNPLGMESNVHIQNMPVPEELADVNVMSQDQIVNPNRASTGQFSQTSFVVDKGVYTTVKLPDANVTKSDAVPRPATSMYTQTTSLDSPDRRQVFLHMSSSTSTTYMSPPELILPHFLKNDYKISYDKIYDVTHTNMQSDKMEAVDQKEYCAEYEGCKCRRCTSTRAKCPPPVNNNPRINKRYNRGSTPPNTVRSNITDQGSVKTGSINYVPKTRKCKCHKCESRSGSKIGKIPHNHKSKRHLATNKRSSRNIAMRVNINKKAASSDNVRKVTLNPIIKSYVDKLLALNKEGHKAIDVMNQDCSSATTPGSSIIDDPRNNNRTKPVLENKISLEQMKSILTQQLLEKIAEEKKNSEQSEIDRMYNVNGKRFNRNPRKKLHKVKSLNISKHLRAKSTIINENMHNVKYRETVSSSTSTKSEPNNNRTIPSTPKYSKSRSKSSHSPRKSKNELKNKTDSKTASFAKDFAKMGNANDNKTTSRSDSEVPLSFIGYKKKSETSQWPEPTIHPRSAAVPSSESDVADFSMQRQERAPPLIASTQTSSIVDDEVKFMKLAENKLQNMEKIADLTEKCTKRLSNLAKVLEEVRRNKSLAYSQISDSASDSDRRSDKNVAPNNLVTKSSIFEIRKDISTENKKSNTAQNKPARQSSVLEITKETSNESRKSDNANNAFKTLSYKPVAEIKKGTSSDRSSDNAQSKLTTQTESEKETNDDRSSTMNIVPNRLKSLSHDPLVKIKSPTDVDKPQKSSYDLLRDIRMEMADGDRISDINLQCPLTQSLKPYETTKSDGTMAPPPTPKQKPEELMENIASSIPEYVTFLTDIPKPDMYKSHVASENQAADSNTLSEEHQNVRSRGKPPPALNRVHLKHGQDYIVPHELSTVVEVDSPSSIKLKHLSSARDDTSANSVTNSNKDAKESARNKANPDLLQSNIRLSRRQTKVSSTDSSDDSKMQMMDLKHFNDIMLKPFISLQEYARQCNVNALDDGSNIDNLPKDDVMNDELSSLHSDGSLPDVIAELLKRNIITEPFKFESASNVNSSTVSSESTLSILALSKMRKEKKSSLKSQNKENIAETSDTLSISSNPDLENAFKKLGMGWASSTLKKTKERLALSSSSNTSSSSMSQFKIKGFTNQNIPVLVSDSVSSAVLTSNKSPQRKAAADTAKNAEQQTSLINSMTVKQFLTNELAKKITFTNRSRRNEADEEFVSLYETRMPEEMKQMVCEDKSMDSGPSGSNNKARTSTPVQIFKSMTYHSSSSSNVSNGLFSNADELSSVKGTSTSMRNHSTSDKDDLTIPNYSLRMRKGLSDCSKSD